ncbi:TPA: hypothetical protein DCG86_06110 [Candidatus Marinimicrobia bacterium]|nr:hypothetical protein [Candidatus Neomarinimicrobiota bacterium]
MLDVVAMLPELKEIRDETLRQKVEAVWQEAAAYRGWTRDLLMKIPFTLLAEGVTIPFIDHVRAVCRLCIATEDVLKTIHQERRTPVNRDVLIAGALLADVGKLLEYEIVNGKVIKSDFGRYLRHPFSGVGLAFKHGVPEAVMHVIATHSKEGAGEKRSPESIIFHHADFIDFELVKG